MKKIIFKALFMVAIAIGGSNYLMYIMTGKSPMSLPDSFSLTGPDFSKAIPAKQDKVYKWTDENGKTHFSSEPPPDTESASLLEVDPNNVNVIQSVKPRKRDGDAAATPDISVGNVYSPSNVKKLINDAKDVQNKLNKRYEEAAQ